MNTDLSSAAELALSFLDDVDGQISLIERAEHPVNAEPLANQILRKDLRHAEESAKQVVDQSEAAFVNALVHRKRAFVYAALANCVGEAVILPEYRRKKRDWTARAGAEFEKAAQLIDDPSDWFNCGISHDGLGNRQEAIAAFRRAAESESSLGLEAKKNLIRLGAGNEEVVIPTYDSSPTSFAPKRIDWQKVKTGSILFILGLVLTSFSGSLGAMLMVAGAVWAGVGIVVKVN